MTLHHASYCHVTTDIKSTKTHFSLSWRYWWSTSTTTNLVDSRPYLFHFWGGCCRVWPTWSIIISSSAILEPSKPLKSSATANARITKSLFQHFKKFHFPFYPISHRTWCTPFVRQLLQYRRYTKIADGTHKDTCNNQTLPHPTTPLGTLTHKTPPQHTLEGSSLTTSDLRVVMSIVLGLLDTPSYTVLWDIDCMSLLN